MSFRKSKNFGPVRINVSKSGVGGSVGPKGARAGISSTGSTYVRGGSNGIYFHQNLRLINASSELPTIIDAISEAASYGTELSAHLVQLMNEFQPYIATRDRLKVLLPTLPSNSESRDSLEDFLTKWQEGVDNLGNGLTQNAQNAVDASEHIQRISEELTGWSNYVDPQYAVAVLSQIITNNEYGDVLVEGFNVYATQIMNVASEYLK